MAKQDMTIAEQLSRAAEALDQIGTGKDTVTSEAVPAASPAPVGSLSAELLRTDGLLRYGH